MRQRESQCSLLSMKSKWETVNRKKMTRISSFVFFIRRICENYMRITSRVYGVKDQPCDKVPNSIISTTSFPMSFLLEFSNIQFSITDELQTKRISIGFIMLTYILLFPYHTYISIFYRLSYYDQLNIRIIRRTFQHPTKAI